MHKLQKKFVLFFLFLVILDQLAKYIIRSQGGFYICNQNAAFGLNFLSIGWIILGLACLYIIINFEIRILNFKIKPSFKFRNSDLFQNSKFKIRNFLENYAFALSIIMAGAVSNIIDRLYFGCVIDFIDLKFWPIFNLADVFITVGAIILIASLKLKV